MFRESASDASVTTGSSEITMQGGVCAGGWKKQLPGDSCLPSGEGVGGEYSYSKGFGQKAKKIDWCECPSFSVIVWVWGGGQISGG
jgi:hypothetical protein